MHAFRSQSYRRATRFAKTTATAVSLAVLSMVLQPPRASAQAVPAGRPFPVTAPVPPAPRHAEGDERYASALTELKEHVKAARTGPGRTAAGAAQGAARLQAVRDAAGKLEALDREVDARLADVAARLEREGYGAEIRERQRAAEATLRQKREALKGILGRFRAADARGSEAARGKALGELHGFLATQQPDRPTKKLDPNHLPWRTLEAKVRKPATTIQTFRAGAPSAAGLAAAPLAAALATQAPASPSAPEYLAETDSAQLTQAVRDLAASLGGNPVRIFNWVRDNVAYVPSWGAIQGSDQTLSKRSGNAFDTASLLVALYRASGIPARYVHGTIELPVEAAMNWVGGVTTPEAAQQVLGQGGVPNVGVITGNRMTAIRLEHVWVEAWVDFAPSRGALGTRGDSWVSLDASFKQSHEAPALVAQANVPVDAAAFAAGLLDGATVNEAEGWIQNPNTAVVGASFRDYLRGVNGYIGAQAPAATNGNVFGTRAVVAEDSEVLAAGLPYRTVVVGARFADVPTNLTHRFRYTIYASEIDRAAGEPLVQFEDALPRLAGKKITLLYAPASQADATLLSSYLPRPHADGTAPTTADFAAVRLPAYLIQLKPELRVDGILRATGAAVTMGTSLFAVGAFTELDTVSGWDATEDHLTAGQVTAIGLDLHGTHRRQLEGLRARMEATKSAIDRSDMANVTGELFAGDIVTATIWEYFAATELVAKDARALWRVIDIPALSYGLAHLDLEVTSAFGINQSACASGILLDVGHLRSVRWSKDDDQSRWIRYNRQLGIAKSALEHQIPEKLFVTSPEQGEAVSAAKLLGMAAAAGQRIYTLTASNLASALPHLALSPVVLSDIRAAVAAGKEVTVHAQPLTVNGWTGAGYEVIDPATGAGAYLISGGANGGKLAALVGGYLFGLFNALAMAALIASVAVPVAGAAVAFALAAVMLVFIVFAISMIVAGISDDDTYACYAGGFALAFGAFLPNLAGWMQKVTGHAQGIVKGSAIWECVF